MPLGRRAQNERESSSPETRSESSNSERNAKPPDPFSQGAPILASALAYATLRRSPSRGRSEEGESLSEVVAARWSRMNEEHGARVRRLLDELDDCLLDKVAAADPGIPSKTPFKLLSLREAFGHRLADLGRRALELFDEGHPIAASVLTRAVIETTSLLFSLNSAVQTAAETGSVEGLDDRLMDMGFGSRAGWSAISATNILTRIDKMDRAYPGVRSTYDELSEIAHPNLAGGIAGYGSLDEATWTLHLSQSGKGHPAENAALPALSGNLGLGILFYDQIAPVYPKVSEICHRAAAEQIEKLGAEP